jgi:excisionase family DNA binding protein
MGFSINSLVPELTNEYITVRSASEFSGYNQQYLRRLLRKGVLKTRKIGQIWLIDQRDFKDYLKEVNQSKDKRFGPQI